MAADRRKELRSAERLLKQGKLQAALGELEKTSDPGSDDLLTLNRLGDLLARQGRRGEAVAHYRRIAGRFSDGGFVPKAVAIYKKILRLDPDDLEATIRLGELYLLQNLRGEGRSYLLHAATRCLETGESVRAREIFERLVAADPQDPRSRLRLAELKADAGESVQAAEDFVGVARTFLEQDEAHEAEKLYRRAAELLPESPVPTLGLARCLHQQGRADEAVALLEQATARQPGAGPLIGELALSYEAVGRSRAALEALAGAPLLEVPLPVWSAVLRGCVGRSAAGEAWSCIDPLLAGVSDRSRLAAVLETLSEVERAGHVPALERLVELHKELKDEEGTRRALQALARACDACSMTEAAASARAAFAALEAPAAPTPAKPRATPAVVPRRSRPASRPQVPRAAAVADLAPEIEAPAVPLNRADEEFVAGRLTQSEVLDKYGMQGQALEQVEEVTSRYPGHVRAQESRVCLLRALGRPVAEALVQLAVARRAEGDTSGAQEAAAMAAAAGAMPPEMERLLADLGLLDGKRPDGPAAPRAAAACADDDDDIDVVIDLEGADGAPLAEGIASSTEPESERAAAPAAPVGGEDVDLREIAEALEAELLDEEPLQPEEGPGLAMQEMLGTFRDRVAQEVAIDDFRTHYDLGIAYKEMGLVDEAIQEFEHAAQSPGLRREACVMIAVCHRDRSDLGEAARWYRRALEAMDGSQDAASDLRYELAEALAAAGDLAAALEEFRGLQRADPTFRDVDGRVHELEAQLQP